MDKFIEQSSQLLQRPKSRKLSKKMKRPVKITYISSPTMFTATNASEFRAIVQEFTGKDSKVLDNWDPCTATSNEESTLNNSETTSRLTMESESADHIFLNYASSSSPEMEDSFFWNGVSESLFGFQSPCLFV